jgi:hypothetical protein
MYFGEKASGGSTRLHVEHRRKSAGRGLSANPSGFRPPAMDCRSVLLSLFVVGGEVGHRDRLGVI